MDNIVYWESPQDLKLPSFPAKSEIIYSCISKNWSLVASSSNVFKVDLNISTCSVTYLNFANQVAQLACNSHFALILTAVGEIWAYGTDEFKSGLFGADNLYTSLQPVKVKSIAAEHIKFIAVGATHAAGINEDGLLFTWGTAKSGELGELDEVFSLPKSVKNADFFNCAEVVCGNQFTAIRTEAGFVYLYCQRQGCAICGRNFAYPCSFSALESQFITKISGFGTFLSVLNDKGECYIIEECFCVYQLTSVHFITDIVGSESSLFGIDFSKSVIYNWKKENSNEWKNEMFAVIQGDVRQLVSSSGKAIGILGKKLSIKMLSRIKNHDSSIANTRKNSIERICFEEILTSCGFTANSETRAIDITIKDQGFIGKVLAKISLRASNIVFRQFWFYSLISEENQKNLQRFQRAFALAKWAEGLVSMRKKWIVGAVCKDRYKALKRVNGLVKKCILVECSKGFYKWKIHMRGKKNKEVKEKCFRMAFRLLKDCIKRTIKASVSNIIEKRTIERVKSILPLILVVIKLKPKAFFKPREAFTLLKSILPKKQSSRPKLSINPNLKVSIDSQNSFSESERAVAPSPTLSSSFKSEFEPYTTKNDNPFNQHCEPKTALILPSNLNELSPGKDSISLRSQVLKQISEKKSKNKVENLKIGFKMNPNSKTSVQLKRNSMAPKEPSTPTFTRLMAVQRRSSVMFGDHYTHLLADASRVGRLVNASIFSAALRTLQEVFFDIVRKNKGQASPINNSSIVEGFNAKKLRK